MADEIEVDPWTVDNDTWLEFLGPPGEEGGDAQSYCGLCGNSGVVDTRGKVRSPSGEDRPRLLHLPERSNDQARSERCSTTRRKPDMKISVITDWRTEDDELPDVAPGAEFERVITAQRFIILHRIRVVSTQPDGAMILARLEIGALLVPFELDSVDGLVRTYRLKDLDGNSQKSLLLAGAAAMKTAVAIAPAMNVHTILRNEGTRPAKPRVALIVQEEDPR